MRIKVNFHGIETFFVELPMRQKEAMRMILSGKEVPDKTTKADLIRIIEFLGKKFTLTESEEELIESKGKNKISLIWGFWGCNRLKFSSKKMNMKNDFLPA